jgi:rod shape-determining protein MreC
MGSFWKNFLKIGILFLLFLSIIVINFTDKEKKRFFKFPGRILSIPVFLAGELAYEIKNGWRRYIYLIKVEKENERLKAELLQKENEINFLKEKLRTLERLQGLLGYREIFEYPTLIGNVIGYSSDGGYEVILINAGEKAGVKEGMPVVSYKGLIGVVTRVYPFSSSVLLITDKNISVDVINTRTLEKAILTGDGKNGCKLKYFSKTGDVAIGDVFQTAGISGLFPRGISVGTVVSITEGDEGLFKEVRVKPFVDPNKVNEVLVIMKR